MRPIPIPDHCVPDGCKRYVIGPPDGDLTNETISPVEVVAGIVDGQVHMCALVMLEPGELARLAAMDTPAIWLTMLTPQIPPFDLHVADAAEWDEVDSDARPG